LSSLGKINCQYTESPTSHTYQYNEANQRTRADLEDGSFWVYQYDALGQVISGRRYWPDGAPVDGQQFDYAFDDIGNRTASGGRASAQSAHTSDFQNQYSQRSVAGVIDVMGVANPTANVTVNGNAANRKGDYFHWALTVANGSAQYPGVNVVSQYGATQTLSGEAFVPAATEAFAYDADGNLTQDGRWDYLWDGENRLVKMTKRYPVVDTCKMVLPGTDSEAAFEKMTFEYDHAGRRVARNYFSSVASASPFATVVYAYDGWDVIGELNGGANNALITAYTWGNDLSGTRSGAGLSRQSGAAAGGVGGLIKVKHEPTSTQHFVGYDGNGNVAALYDGTTGAITARYQYGPFGEVVRATGSMARKNGVRFSSKLTDNETGLVYYGYRYYNPSTGRWPSRDPIGENGGINLYGFVQNNSINEIDPFGLAGSAGGWLNSQIANAINTARVQGIYRKESSKVFKVAGRAEVGFKYGVIAIRASGSAANACVDATIYANFYGQLKFPFVFGTQLILEPSGGAAGKVECCLCTVGGSWEYQIGPFSCRGDVTINAGVKTGIRSPGFDFEDLKAYTEGGGLLAGLTASGRRRVD
jgi:RHS repeat-associated protein